MAFVYWVHLPEHTNMFSEGYIGYTSRTVDIRWKHHLKEAKNGRYVNYPIYNAIRKYGNKLIVTTLVEGSEDYCLDLEYKLRPEMKIGWNIQIGGNKGTKGVDVTQETREKISKAGKGRKFSEEHRRKIGAANSRRVYTDLVRKNMSDAKKGIRRSIETCEKHSKTLTDQPWRNRSVRDVANWLLAGEMQSYHNKHPNVSAKTLAKVFGFTEGRVVAILKKIRAGWIPYNDLYWIAFSEENKIGEATHAKSA